MCTQLNLEKVYIKSKVFLMAMESLSVRTFAKADLGFPYELNTIEQWNDRKEDLVRIYSYEPRGCFIAEVEKKPVGHVIRSATANLDG
jgi:hypothetical protein